MSELTLKSAKSLYVNLGLTIQDLEAATDSIIKGLAKLKEMKVSNPLILNGYIASLHIN